MACGGAARRTGSVQSDADLRSLLASTYHRDGGAGHALTYWRGRQALAKDVLALREAVRALLHASELLAQLASPGATPALTERLAAARTLARQCLPEQSAPTQG